VPFAIKLIVSLSVVAWIVYGVDMHDLQAVLQEVDVPILAGATLLLAASTLIVSWRWGIVLRRLNADIHWIERVSNCFVGQFFNQTLPSTVGGDGVRMWLARRSGMALRTAANSVLIDRLMGLTAPMVLALVGLPWLTQLNPSGEAPLAVAFTATLGLVGLLSLTALDKLPKVVTAARFIAPITTLSVDARVSLFQGKSGLLVLACSLLVHLGLAVAVWLIAVSLSIQVTLLACTVLVPMVMVVSAIPISVAGWGLREGAMVAAFSLVDVPAEQSFAVSLLFGLCMVVAGLPGGVLWLRRREHATDADTKSGSSSDSATSH
jgi:glycosyltransferase 2 family protein